MDTEQSRRLITLHDNADRAVLNLRNAGAMSTDDPRATELLEEAGDAYAEAFTALFTEQERVCHPLLKASSVTGPESHAGPTGVPGQPEGFEPGKAAWIVKDGHGAGFIEARGDMTEGFLPVRLTTDAHFRDQDFPEGATIAVAVDCLSLEAPADAASAAEGGGDGTGEGSGTASA